LDEIIFTTSKEEMILSQKRKGFSFIEIQVETFLKILKFREWK
jgi:hypothetical protein